MNVNKRSLITINYSKSINTCFIRQLYKTQLRTIEDKRIAKNINNCQKTTA